MVPATETDCVAGVRGLDDQGLVVAQFVLGDMYAHAQGVPEDHIRAYTHGFIRGRAPRYLPRRFFWDLLVYLLEGLVFLVTGLQIRTLLDRMDTILLRGPLLAVLLTVAVVVVARFVWVYPAIYLPRWLSLDHRYSTNLSFRKRHSIAIAGWPDNSAASPREYELWHAPFC
jgi:NhaP-type Na+/H+ or K+/H+ antiporter